MNIKRFDWSRIAFSVILGGLSIFFIIPLVWMLSASAKFERDVMVYPIQWIPKDWNWVNNFHKVWLENVPFSLFYWNSLKLAVIATVSTLLFSSMAAFSFAKLRAPGKGVMFGMMMSFMIIPEQATLVPRFIMIKWMGLYNTHTGIIVMLMFSMYFTFLMRQFMLGVHNEFIESAKIDGAGYVRIYAQIMLPLSKPILATAGIIKFIWTWNDYQNPLIFLFTKELYPLPLGIQFFRQEYSNNVSLMMMAAVSAIIPLIIVFIALQKQVINGITVGGVKG
ncbi:carbohydrate ABC transporter permease [Paenibacillus sp. MMS20-IR301]|uniref:carbohydrate ABC transporter permease n=1 Tax=Paenibacillus sp. MMS20-IR301 TaxID=2895946 RepID=UPI0028E6EDE9|nr:carbohydrate ABC transporter permease [Paenibacillus sp. MMS20-IR301]WNS43097.1 carbohydrate ABC transporter permease [Paenibacillus sp. MMS20-IR301]